jgi:hypothetical protein
MHLQHYEIFYDGKRLPLQSKFPYRQPLGDAALVMVDLEAIKYAMQWLEIQIPDLDLPGVF